MLVPLVISGCGKAQQATPAPTPPPPATLSNLPAEAGRPCYCDSNYNESRAVIWELPGIEPADKNSASRGRRGRELGYLKGCEHFIVTGYEWSRFDRKFYVFIEAQGVKGWVPIELITFDLNAECVNVNELHTALSRTVCSTSASA
jgi:hypothetical protein